MQAGSSNKQLMDPYCTAGTPVLPAQGPVWVEEAAIKITQGKMKEPGPMEWNQGVSYIICLERRQMLTNQVGEGRGERPSLVSACFHHSYSQATSVTSLQTMQLGKTDVVLTAFLLHKNSIYK